MPIPMDACDTKSHFSFCHYHTFCQQGIIFLSVHLPAIDPFFSHFFNILTHRNLSSFGPQVFMDLILFFSIELGIIVILSKFDY